MASESQNARLETFCDGVFAIAITLLVLEFERPNAEQIGSSGELWRYLLHLLPSVYAFLLSFLIIGVQWATHHLFMKLVDRASDPFIYANIFMLLPYAVMPFPTALLAEFWATNASSPAVVLYSFTILLGNIGWLLITSTALKPRSLARSEAARKVIRNIRMQSVAAFGLYLSCTVLAFWFPLVVSIVLSLSYLVWLVLGAWYKDEGTN